MCKEKLITGIKVTQQGGQGLAMAETCLFQHFKKGVFRADSLIYSLLPIVTFEQQPSS